MILTSEQIDLYKNNGFLVLKGFYSLEKEIYPILKAIHHLMGILIKKYKLPIQQEAFSPQTFDSGFERLIHTNRSYGGELYDALKNIIEFRRLINSRKNEKIYQQLSGAIAVGCCPVAQGIRIDNPDEDFFRSLWHQEMVYHPQSADGATFWSPLVSITPEMGPLQICAKSHVNGLMKYVENQTSGNAYSLIFDEQSNNLECFERVEPLASIGDLCILNYLTVHQSGFNRSAVARWTMQMRYFNFDDPFGVEMGWVPSLKAGDDVQQILQLCLANKEIKK